LRFAPIVKIRKLALDNLENEMARLNFAIAQTKEDIINLTNLICTSQKPKHGVMAQILAFQAEMDTHRQEIVTKTNSLNTLEFNKLELTQKLKLAHIELEKMKYLEEQELLAKALKLKKQEAADLDEIGLMLFNNRKTF
jgi:flagellar biosynthesis chaperone FliJ